MYHCRKFDQGTSPVPRPLPCFQRRKCGSRSSLGIYTRLGPRARELGPKDDAIIIIVIHDNTVHNLASLKEPACAPSGELAQAGRKYQEIIKNFDHKPFIRFNVGG